MKLGCGNFTRLCDPSSIDDSKEVAGEIVKKYIRLFPQFDGLEIKGFGFNHWAKIDNDSDYVEIDNAIIVTSDNGVGFKFAPQIVLNVISCLLD